MWSGRDINPFSIDSFAEHTRAGHGQWMDDYRLQWLNPLKSPGKNQAKRCGDVDREISKP